MNKGTVTRMARKQVAAFLDETSAETETVWGHVGPERGYEPRGCAFGWVRAERNDGESMYYCWTSGTGRGGKHARKYLCVVLASTSHSIEPDAYMPLLENGLAENDIDGHYLFIPYRFC
jgi:hypothetical protein